MPLVLNGYGFAFQPLPSAKKNDCFTSRWKSIGTRERKFYYFFVYYLSYLLFFLFSLAIFKGRGVGWGFHPNLSLKSQSHWWHGARPAEDYALNVLKLDSTFFEITFLTASISVEIAFSSVSNCFNFNSKFLSWAWMISIFELISWISLSYWFLL